MPESPESQEEFLNKLPPNLQEMTQLLGLEKTLALMGLYGGRELYVPLQFSPEHQICIRLGYEAAEKLARRYGGSFVLIPVGAAYVRAIRDRRLAEDRRTMTVNELSEKYGLTVRRIWKILEGQSQRTRYRQQELFESPENLN